MLATRPGAPEEGKDGTRAPDGRGMMARCRRVAVDAATRELATAVEVKSIRTGHVHTSEV